MDSGFMVVLFSGAIRLATPLIIAAIGEVFAERSGVVNLGIEGIMSLSAILGFIVAFATCNALAGMLAGLTVGLLMGVVFAILTVVFGLNQIVTGLGVFFFGLGLSAFIFRTYTSGFLSPPRIEPLSETPIPLLSKIPVIGQILFQHNIMVYLTFILALIFSVILFRTTLGLKIRAAGENPRAVDTVGVNVWRIRILCVLIGCGFAGLAGAYLSVASVGQFFEGMVAGRGFIVIAVVFLGGWAIDKMILGALLFGGVYELQLQFQSLGIAVPYQFMLMLPYIVTIITLAVMSRRSPAPASLGVPYKRGE